MSAKALELRDVVVEYERHGAERVRAVAGVSLSVERGRIVALVGESGCGKSSLARAAVGLVRPAAGSVLFEGRPVTPIGRRARGKDFVRLQLVFQNAQSSLNPRRRAGSLIADGLGALDRVPKNGLPTRVRELCDLVGLPPSSIERFPHELSGGQRQRVAIARALAADPSVIVLDEPLASLDASAQAQLADVLAGLARTLGLGLLLISHDLAFVRHLADEISVMYLGAVVETGPIEAAWMRPLHPYTEALVHAVPVADGSGTLPETLSGDVPDPSRRPRGCPFHPRCPYALDRCREQTPPLVDVTDGRAAACLLHPAGEEPRGPGERAARVGL